MSGLSARLRIALAAAAVVSLAGCSTRADVDQLNQNEFVLRGMIASDRQQIDSLQTQIHRFNDQIAELKHTAESRSEGGDASALDQRMSKLEGEVTALQAGLASAPGVAASGVPITATTGGPVPGSRVPAAPPPADLAPAWPQDLDKEIDAANGSRDAGVKLYREGLQAMKDGKYPFAILKFTQLQHANPKSPLTEPAQYFAANALYETGKYDQSILQFNDLVMRSPKGRFASQALLRQAQAFIKLNDRIDARLTLQKLLSDHAGTPEATAANTMMKTLASD